MAAFDKFMRQLYQMAARAELEPLNDQQLLQRYVAMRDEYAFGTLVRRHGSMVWSVCWHVLDQCQDAEDAFQATFMTLTRKAAKTLWRESIEGWLQHVAYQVATKAKIARERRRLHEKRRMEMQSDNYESSTQREWGEVLDRELSRMPEKYRSPLILCYLEGLTREKAAQRMNISIGRLEWQLERGRDCLRKRLAKYGIEINAAMLGAYQPPETGAGALPPGLVSKTIEMTRIYILSNGVLETTGVSPQVAALVKGTLGIWTVKAKLCVGMMLLTLAGVGIGVARCPGFFLNLMGWEQPREFEPGPVNKKVDEPQSNKIPPRTDRYGDPLPAGALVRLGTVRFRPPFGDYNSKAVAFTPDGKALLTVDRFPCLWDMNTGRILRQFGGPFEKSGGFGNAALSPDGKLVVARSTRTHLYIWEASTGKLVRQWENSNGIYGLGCGFSPDSKMLVAWSCDDNGRNPKLSLWDIVTGQCRWEQNVKKVQNSFDQTLLSFSPDGKLVADGGSDGVRLLDARTGRLLRTLGHPWPVRHFSFSPDARTLVVGYNKGENAVSSVYLWDIATGGKQWCLDNKDENYTFPIFGPDGKFVASCDGKRGIVLRGAATGKELCCCSHLSWLWNGPLVVSPDSKMIAAIFGPMIRCWDVATGKIIEPSTFQGHEEAVDSVAFTADGKSLISSGCNQAIAVWDGLTGQQQAALRPESRLRPLPGFDVFMSSVAAVSPDGKMVAGRCFDITPGLDLHDWGAFCSQFRASICVWDTATRRELHKFEWVLGRHRLRRVVFSPDSKFLAACVVTNLDHDGTILLWEVASGKKLDFRIEGVDPVFSPDSALLMTRKDGKLLLWEVASGKKVSSVAISEPTGEDSDDAQVVVSPDWRIMAVSTNSGKRKLILYPIYPNKYTKIRLGSPHSIDYPTQEFPWGLALSSDGKMVAVASKDRTVYVRETVTGKERVHFTGHRGTVASLCFSPDGRRLASGSKDTTSLVWDVTGGLLDDQGRLRHCQLSEQQINLLWIDLSSTNAAHASRAIWTLVATPEQTIPYFQKHLAPVPVEKASTQRIVQLIASLDDEKFQIRQNAMAELMKLGEIAEPSLRQALDKQSPSLEMRRRLEHLLAAVENQRKEPAGELIRALRSIEVLEQIGTSEARQMLETLAQGAPGARQTSEAQAALRRLQRAKRL